MMFKIFGGVTVVLLLALGAAGVMIKWQDGKIDDLNEQVGSLKADVQKAGEALEAQKLALAKVEAQREADQRELNLLGQEVARAAKERDDAVNTLNGFRSRILDAALAKPGLVGRLATRAVADLMRGFESATQPDGGEPGGGDPAVRPATPAGRAGPEGAGREGPDAPDDGGS